MYLSSLLIIPLNRLLVILAMRTWAVWQSSRWILAILIVLAIVGDDPVRVSPTHRVVEDLCDARDRGDSAGHNALDCWCVILVCLELQL